MGSSIGWAIAALREDLLEIVSFVFNVVEFIFGIDARFSLVVAVELSNLLSIACGFFIVFDC
jgi:hypothetical protein